MSEPVMGEFNQKLALLIQNCAERGANMRVYCQIRTLEEQAELFRISRTTVEIEKKAKWYREKELDILADVLIGIGPQGTAEDLGKHKTHAGPGESWHNVGLAADAVPIVGGNAMWSDKEPRWRIWGEEAVKLGFVWGGNWKNFVDKPHVQLAKGNSPLANGSQYDLLRMIVMANRPIEPPPLPKDSSSSDILRTS